MNIGILLPKFAAGGAEQVVLELGLEFIRAGHKVTIMAMATGGPIRKRFETAGLDIVEFGLERRFSPTPSWFLKVRRGRQTLAKFFRQKNFDIIHTHLMGPDVEGLQAARQAGVPVIVHTIHNVYQLYAGKSLRDYVLRYLRQRAFRNYDHLFAVNDTVRDWAIHCHMTTEEKITTIRNGIDFLRLKVAEDRDVLRARFHWHASEKILLTVGSLTEQKNQLVLVDVIGLLKKQGINCRLIIAGAGPRQQELQQAITKFDVKDQVELLGIRHDIPALMKAADLFVFPSYWEGLPIALLEAMAAGLPVVASDLPVHRDLLEEGRLGTICPKEPAAAVEQSVFEALSNSGLAEMARRGQTAVQTRFSSQRMADEYLAYFEELLLRKNIVGR